MVKAAVAEALRQESTRVLFLDWHFLVEKDSPLGRQLP